MRWEVFFYDVQICHFPAIGLTAAIKVSLMLIPPDTRQSHM